MQLSGDYTFDGPRQAVWDLLQDPEVLQAAMPGAEAFEQTGDDAYQGKIQVKVGPVNGLFNAKINLTDKEPPEHYTMKVDAQGPTGFAQGAARVSLSELDAATTRMHYDASLQVGGRIASVGQRMLDTVSKSLTRQSLDTMNQALQARLDAQAGKEPEKAYTPPSQSDFARGVAKDVAAETVRSGRVAWIALGVLVVILLLWWLVF